jgi:hypothetical protein
LACKGCQSEMQSVLNGEVAIHFPGMKGLEKPIVWVFPKLVVCVHCGFTEFAIPERELQVLKQGSSVEGAIVSTDKAGRPPANVRANPPSPRKNE